MTLDLQQAARDHLWMHFTRMAAYEDAEVPIIVRGDGCYLEDSNGKRYLDALAGLFAVQIGYSHGDEVGQAAHEQMKELPFYTNWSYAHPRAIELAHEIAQLAPGDLNRAFFVSGGSEAVESAWKLARQYHAAHGERRWKAIARRTAYHGTTMGALSINGIAAIKNAFEPLVPDTLHVRSTNRYHRPEGETEGEFTEFLLDDLEQAIIAAGPSTVAMVIMEPVQNAGGAFTPPAGYFQGVRAICDEYGILLCADEVITGFGRLGEWFGSTKYDIRPDLVTSAKGLSSAYASIGAVIATDKVFEPFLDEQSMYAHGITFGGHPVMCAIALKNIEIMKREKIVENVRDNGDAFRNTLAQLLDLDIVGDLRGTGYFYALELVKDKETKGGFSDEDSETLLRGFLSPRLFERGLICRADDRGDPVVQISPPLIATQAEFDEIAGNPRRRSHRGAGADAHQVARARRRRDARAGHADSVRVLVVGTGGVGSAVAPIAARRDFFERIVFADLDPARAAARSSTGSATTRVRRGAARRFGRRPRSPSSHARSSCDAIVNAADPRFNPPIFEAAFDAGCTYLDMAMTLSDRRGHEARRRCSSRRSDGVAGARACSRSSGSASSPGSPTSSRATRPTICSRRSTRSACATAPTSSSTATRSRRRSRSGRRSRSA